MGCPVQRGVGDRHLAIALRIQGHCERQFADVLRTCGVRHAQLRWFVVIDDSPLGGAGRHRGVLRRRQGEPEGFLGLHVRVIDRIDGHGPGRFADGEHERAGGLRIVRARPRGLVRCPVAHGHRRARRTGQRHLERHGAAFRRCSADNREHREGVVVQNPAFRGVDHHRSVCGRRQGEEERLLRLHIRVVQQTDRHRLCGLASSKRQRSGGFLVVRPR